MAIWNLGSINADMVYTVPHLPGPGETLAATELNRLWVVRAPICQWPRLAQAHMSAILGSVGYDGRWAVDRLLEYGVDIRQIHFSDHPTGHAIIAVDNAGETRSFFCPEPIGRSRMN